MNGLNDQEFGMLLFAIQLREEASKTEAEVEAWRVIAIKVKSQQQERTKRIAAAKRPRRCEGKGSKGFRCSCQATVMTGRGDFCEVHARSGGQS